MSIKTPFPYYDLRWQLWAALPVEIIEAAMIGGESLLWQEGERQGIVTSEQVLRAEREAWRRWQFSTPPHFPGSISAIARRTKSESAFRLRTIQREHKTASSHK